MWSRHRHRGSATDHGEVRRVEAFIGKLFKEVGRSRACGVVGRRNRWCCYLHLAELASQIFRYRA